MKKALCIILAYAILMTVLVVAPFTVKADEKDIAETGATSGTTGDCTWKIEGTKLTISGSGKTGSFDSSWNGITEVVIENGVTLIGKGAFNYCNNLTKISIPDTVKGIGNYAFQGCTKLSNINIPKSVTMIGSSAFSGCSSLTNITIPDSVTSIEWGTFRDCTKLTSITIGKSVKSIGIKSFEGCNRLTSVHINDIGAWCSISFEDYFDNPLYYAHNLYLNDLLITELVIPESVNRIGSYAFYGCNNLKSVTIPKSVTYISSATFGYYYDFDFEKQFKNDALIIYGYKNTAAERYANSHGFTFVDLDGQPTEPTQAPTTPTFDPTKTTDRDILGDMDGDGAISIVDSTFIQRYLIGAQTPYPIGGKIK